MLDKGLVGIPHLLKRLGTKYQQTFLFQAAMKALDNSLDAIDKSANTLPEDWWE
jgi:hypothetical protein